MTTCIWHLALIYASSLGRNETDAERRRRLSTTDGRSTVEAYAERGRSAFFGHRPIDRTLKGREVITELSQTYPETAQFWAEKIVAVKDDVFETIFGRIEPDWMSKDAIEFARRMLLHNRGMIGEVALA
jgi:hypothetical protein